MKESRQINFLENQEKEKILNLLEEGFGIKEIPGEIIQLGKDRIFLYQGSLDGQKINEMEKSLPIERVGIYLGKLMENRNGEKAIRLSIEGSQIFRSQIKKNIVEFDKEKMQEWMMGREVLIKTGVKGFVVIKYQNDLIGCGNASEEKITNFIPKNRRLKAKS